ncbi:uncharacterized protein LOC135400362 isoform X2 [Ornithodoros turicata]|uniref:uncharacterized protein LOC135400362 isoform X2 n=1 Tax=Ornithodoros turicata TaxID=34597 RepID=UPI003138D2B4
MTSFLQLLPRPSSARTMALLLVAVLFALLVRISDSTCPDKERLRPCHCYTFGSYERIECREVQNVDSLRASVATLRGTHVFEFELALCDLAQVPSDIFKDFRVSELYTYMVNYSSAAGTFNLYESLDETLYMMEIKRGLSMDHFNWTSMQRLSSLQRLYIFSSNLMRIGPEFSTMPQSLTHVMVQGGDLEVIEDGAFAGLQLRDLEVSYTKLTTLSRQIFPPAADKLEVLSFRNNKLRHLPDDMFVDMPSLNLLDLSANELVTLSEKVLKPVLQNMHLVDISRHGLCFRKPLPLRLQDNLDDEHLPGHGCGRPILAPRRHHLLGAHGARGH